MTVMDARPAMRLRSDMIWRILLSLWDGWTQPEPTLCEQFRKVWAISNDEARRGIRA